MQNRKTLECDVQMPLSSKLSSMDHENEVDTENEKIDDYVEEADINCGTTSQLRRSSRIRKLVQRLTYDSCIAQHYLFMAKVNDFIEPNCFEDAFKNREWKCAMQEEIDALYKNDTWELVPRPNDKKVIGCKWVYKSKFNSDGTLNRCKARLVAKGYSQTYGLDYEETFSPVAKMASIRVVISLVASLKWNTYQIDVKNAFLNGILKEEVFMEQPHGFKDNVNPDYVCKLKRGLYGLKQSPRIWFERLGNYLKSMNFKQSCADASVFMNDGANGKIIIVLYVDDLIIIGDNDEFVQKIKHNMSNEFEMKDLGELKYFLGIEVIKCINGWMLSQKKYMVDMLKEFSMYDCKPMQTPMQERMTLDSTKNDALTNVKMYQQIVGKLIYLTITRPDIAFSVGIVSRYMQEPMKAHMVIVKRILRYIKGTLEYGLLYSNDKVSPSFFCDADWAGDKETRRSTSGYCCSLGSGVVSWLSKKQPTVALSTTEAEYRVATQATCEATWFEILLKDVGVKIERPLVIYCDNISAILLAKNPIFHARTKHIEVHYHFVREKIVEGLIDLRHIKTEDQVADIFTKPLPKEKFFKFRRKLGLYDLNVLEREC